MTRNGIRWCGGVAVGAILLAACSGEGSVLDVSGVSVLTAERPSGGMDALGGGPLEVIDGCLGAGGAVVVWPHGTEVVMTDPLTIEIPDNGTFVIGEAVEVGGGYVWEQESGPRPDPLIVGGVQVPASCAESTIFLAR